MSGGTISSANYTIGGPKIYFTPVVGSSGVLSSVFRTTTTSLGNIVSAEINPDITYNEHYTSVNGERVLDKEAAVTRKITVSMVLDEMNQTNLKRFFLGEDGSASQVKLLQSTVAEGSAQIVVETDIGQDAVMMIPKCSLRPDGAWNLNAEDWHEINMQFSVLKYIDGDSPANATYNATFVAAPFGILDTSNL